MNLYFIIDRHERHHPHRWIIHTVTNYDGKSGRTTRAINHLTDDRLARCSTIGTVEAEGAVVADAVDALIGDVTGVVNPVGAFPSLDSVIEHYAAHGIDVIPIRAALDMLPTATKHRNHHDETLLPGRFEDGEEGYWSLDLRAVLNAEEALRIAGLLSDMGFVHQVEAIHEALGRQP